MLGYTLWPPISLAAKNAAEPPPLGLCARLWTTERWYRLRLPRNLQQASATSQETILGGKKRHGQETKLFIQVYTASFCTSRPRDARNCHPPIMVCFAHAVREPEALPILDAYPQEGQTFISQVCCIASSFGATSQHYTVRKHIIWCTHVKFDWQMIF